MIYGNYSISLTVCAVYQGVKVEVRSVTIKAFPAFGKRVSRRGREKTPWALLGEASRRRAQGCNSSYIEE